MICAQLRDKSDKIYSYYGCVFAFFSGPIGFERTTPRFEKEKQLYDFVKTGIESYG